MDWLTFISQVISAIAWPTALIVFALVFRGKLASLLERVREVTGPAGTSAKFGDELEKARVVAEQLPDPVPSTAVEPAESDDPFLDLASKHPAAAVLRAYQDVERELEELASRMGLVFGPESRRQKVIFNILAKAQLSPLEVELFQRIRETRNAAVHLARPMTTGEALEYKELTDRFIANIKAKPAF